MSPQEAFYHRAPDAPDESWLVSGLLGVEIELRGGVLVPDSSSAITAPGIYPSSYVSPGSDPTGDILRGRIQPFGPDPFAVGGTVGYRFLPFLSAGASFDYATFDSIGQDQNGDYADHTTPPLQRSFWQAGAYVRFYAMRASSAQMTGGGAPYFNVAAFDRLQPWAELGLAYTEDTASYTRGGFATAHSGQPLTSDYYLTFHGLAASARLGLDWRLAPVFALGPMIGYSRVFALNGCVDVEPQTDVANSSGLPAENTCSSSVVQANGYNLFFGGIFAKVTLGPDVR